MQSQQATFEPRLVLFYVLVASQVGHMGEHVAQFAQIHGLGWEPRHAHGVVGALDIEWVHVLWNTWILGAVLVLLSRYGSNAWLWPMLLLAAWHEAEHVWVMAAHLATGQAGSPGLLAAGGALGRGLPVRRPELRFLNNGLELALLGVALLQQRTRTRPARMAA